MKTLVVGGAGYIGGIVTDALIKKTFPSRCTTAFYMSINI